jgi:hypothetical protein
MDGLFPEAGAACVWSSSTKSTHEINSRRACPTTSVMSAAKRHRIETGGTRPDIVIQRTGATPRSLVLEIKATRSPSYLAQGLVQLLAYAHERRNVLDRPGCAWLVAPKSASFHEAPPSDTEPLWVVDADSVAEAAVAALAA